MPVMFRKAIVGVGDLMFKASGVLAMDQDCCCPCYCDVGTLPSSVDVYFENCTGVMTCLEGMTINLTRASGDPDFGECGFFTEDICFCDDGTNAIKKMYLFIDILSLSSPNPIQWQLVVFVSGLPCSSGATANDYADEIDFSPTSNHDCSAEKSGNISFGSGASAGAADYTLTPIL